MSTKIKNFFTKTLPTILLSSLIVATFVYAWQEPTAPPPRGNVPAPINVGPQTQYKAGGLGVGGLFVTYSDTYLGVSEERKGVWVCLDQPRKVPWVGIGTACPNALLDVAGDIKAHGNIILVRPPTPLPVPGRELVLESWSTAMSTEYTESESISYLDWSNTNDGCRGGKKDEQFTCVAGTDPDGYTCYPDLYIIRINGLIDYRKQRATCHANTFKYSIRTDSGTLQFLNNDGRINFVIGQDGNVGIGTTAPTQKLDVAGYVKGTGLCIGDDCRTSWPAGGEGYWKFFKNTLSPSSTEWNVGIGIGVASAKLDVNGNIKATGANIMAQSIFEIPWQYVYDSSLNGHDTPRCNSEGTNGAVTCDRDPTVADCNMAGEPISGDPNNAPQYCYDWAEWTRGAPVQRKFVKTSAIPRGGWIVGTTGYPGDTIAIGGDAGGDDLEIKISAPPSRDKVSLWNVQSLDFSNLYLKNLLAYGNVIAQGNVGIGTTAPTEKLDVDGTIRMRGWDAVLHSYYSSETGDSRYYDLIGTYRGWNPEAVYIAGYNFVNTPTNLQRRATKYVSIGGAGSERLWVDLVGGKVGIGTTTPAYKLDVAGDINGNRLCIRGDCKDSWPTGGQNYWVLTGNNLTPSSTAWNVGIGTTTPAFKLDVQGGWLRVGSGSNAIQLETQSGFHRIAFEELRFWDWSFGNDMVTFKDGNVGIGTTAPVSKLSVLGNLTLLRIPGANIRPGPGHEISLQSPSNNTATERDEWQEATNEADTCDGDRDNIYICRRAEGGKTCLDVANGNFRKKSNVTCVAGTDVYTLRTNAGTLQFLNTDGEVKFVIGQNGNVGIGTTEPTAKLELGNNQWLMLNAREAAGINFYETGEKHATHVQYGGKIFYNGVSNTLQIVTRHNNQDKLGISIKRATGNVGIGTTNPQAKLHVSGDVFIEGNIKITGLEETGWIAASSTSDGIKATWNGGTGKIPIWGVCKMWDNANCSSSYKGTLPFGTNDRGFTDTFRLSENNTWELFGSNWSLFTCAENQDGEVHCVCGSQAMNCVHMKIWYIRR
jgi:hypothetical protein